MSRADDQPQDTFPKPALDKLHQDQDAIRAELLDGFAGYREAISWYQRASVRTFGKLKERFAPDALLNRTRMRMLCESSEIAAQRREEIYSRELAPACRNGFVELREQATERLPDKTNEDGLDYERIEIDEQQNPHMRPAFRIIEQRQQQALSELWGGFVSPRALSKWIHNLTSASFGELDEDASARFLSGVSRDMLLDKSSTDAQKFRLMFAVGELLPAFASASMQLQAGAGEDANNPHTDTEDFTLG